MRAYLPKKAKHGLGLFATRVINEGEVILAFAGPIISYQQVLRKRTPDNAFQISRNRYVDLRKPGVLANHSCEPNAGVTPDLILIALKKISKDEEITYDYSACMDKDTTCDFVCDCGARTCRKTIRGFATLPKKKQLYYRVRQVIQKFLIKEQKRKIKN